jgi:hypothetical protein
MPLIYNHPGTQLSEGGDANDPAMVRDLQRDLRALGYLRQGVDGVFGAGTAQAIRSLQYDLLNNRGNSTDSDGTAPVAMVSFNDNGGVRRVTAVTGVLDEALSQCLEAILADDRVPRLPSVTDPRAENQAALAAIAGTASTIAPTPFIAAMVVLESNGQHFHVHAPDDLDTFVTVGLDRNDSAQPARANHITSRGYGRARPRGLSMRLAICRPPLQRQRQRFLSLSDAGDAAAAIAAYHPGELTRCRSAPLSMSLSGWSSPTCCSASSPRAFRRSGSRW